MFGLAGNVCGDVAVVTSDPSRRRTLYLRRAGASAFTARLHITLHNHRRGATVALG